MLKLSRLNIDTAHVQLNKHNIQQLKRHTTFQQLFDWISNHSTKRSSPTVIHQFRQRIASAFLTLVLVFLSYTLCSNPALALSSPQISSQNSRITLGDTGEAVNTIQHRLHALGYLTRPINGTYDHSTQLAIRQFQADHNIPIDGVVGPQTQALILNTPVTIDPLRPEMPPDIQRILTRGKLIVAVLGTDNPPFFMENPTDHQSPVGLDINIAHGLAESLGVEVEFNRSATTFNEVVDQVYQLHADMAISKLSRTLSRAQRVRFSQPYVSMRQGLIVNRLQLAQQTQDSGMIQAIRNFQGKVGVIKSSSYVGFIKEKFPDATIVEYANWGDIVDAVINGDVQAAYRDELEVKKIIRQNPDAALRLQTIALTDTKDQIAMALPWDSSNLQVFVNQYLDTLDLAYNADLVLDEYEDYLDHP